MFYVNRLRSFRFSWDVEVQQSHHHHHQYFHRDQHRTIDQH